MHCQVFQYKSNECSIIIHSEVYTFYARHRISTFFNLALSNQFKLNRCAAGALIRGKIRCCPKIRCFPALALCSSRDRHCCTAGLTAQLHSWSCCTAAQLHSCTAGLAAVIFNNQHASVRRRTCLVSLQSEGSFCTNLTSLFDAIASHWNWLKGWDWKRWWEAIFKVSFT